jgi:hydrogenase expression/formation protein HypC
MRITGIEDDIATIELEGLTQRTSLMLVPDAAVGDFVLVHAGCAITVLDQTEAEERLALFAELLESEDEQDDAAGGFHDERVTEAGTSHDEEQAAEAGAR